MAKTSLPVHLDHDGQTYAGWATASDHLGVDGKPKSYHVVLNGVFFGDLSHHDGHCLITEQRPPDLILAVGDAIARSVSQDNSTDK